MTRDQIQNEALALALQNKKCGIALSMGVGKTYLGLQYIKHYYDECPIKVLVVAPKITILDNWKEEAIKFNLEEMLPSITFTTYLSLNKQSYDYDLIILDECHSLLFSHDEYLANCKSSRILGLTGTPPRYQVSEKGKMVYKYCPIKYKYITDDAIDDNILNDYRIIVHKLKLNTEKTIPVKTTNGTFKASEVQNYNYWSTRVQDAQTAAAKQIASVMRMKTMMTYKSKEDYAAELFAKETDKCIMFCNTQDQADAMCEYSYHSKNPDSEDNLQMFKSGTINKLSCVLQLSEGVNIPNLKSGIILHAYGNERKAQQRIGRMLRLNPDETATIHILCYQGTVDEKWVKDALNDFDESKITYITAGSQLIF